MDYYYYKEYRVSKEQSRFRAEEVKRLLDQAYYAHNRPLELIQRSLDNSLCFGVFDPDDVLVGFARIITDYAVTYYVTDVIIDESHRNHGLGTHLIKYIIECQETKGMKGVLLTTYSHTFYERLGFERNAQKCMIHQSDAKMHLNEEEEPWI